ncbi:DUF6415 family natural product biosynthesis protein [Streptomyces bullii]|uniref:DUF6415 family natural product biosynthesis protein n=1 Tax=Streptomyces bullii TaxID=349910 RepID=A0ABW0US95_9ACTN
MNATHETAAPIPSTVAMVTQATWFLKQPTLLGHQDVKAFEADFRTFVEHLIPQVEELAAARSRDDVPAQVALAGVAEARRRLIEPEAAGLKGEVARVQRLARSVIALCTHYDALTGISMCVVCNRVIDGDDEPWEPYDYASPSGGAARSGGVHAACATRRR